MPGSANELREPGGFSMKRYFSAILTAQIRKGFLTRFATDAIAA
jgi:hypothetical protein